ncbi:MAG: NAD-dependent epimerase/dehydratase family protein [Erysipelotrichaceae bacterium]|nr:NAD-dependent epimerase/dehydratase family protein [Erysipelotrichaceae bacterium]
MKKIYLVTGASGHLGSTLCKQLLNEGKAVRALALLGEEKYVPSGVEIVTGDVTDPASLTAFFHHDEDEEIIVLHCAGIVTIASKANPMVHKVNVEGTRNILRLAKEHNALKVVYVCSVHGLVEAEEGDTTETSSYHPEQIDDQYGKSKAEAANIALDFYKQGLNVNIILPSGIFGPGDVRRNNHMIRAIDAMAKGYIPVSLQGGFDFVDVRDVAAGIIACAEKGRAGESYILSGHYLTVKEILNEVNEICERKPSGIEIPYALVKPFGALAESIGNHFGKGKPLVTPYSLAILNTNGHFSHDKATKDLGYQTRTSRESIRDMIEELK